MARTAAAGARVVVVDQRGAEEEIGGGGIHRAGDVPKDGEAKQGFDVGVVRLGSERVPEEDQGVDALLGDGGTDLLIAADRTAEEAVNGKRERIGDHAAGRAGAEEFVFREGVAMKAGPGEERVLFVIVRDERDAFAGRQRIEGGADEGHGAGSTRSKSLTEDLRS